VEYHSQRKIKVLQEKPNPVPLCPTQTTHGLAQDRTWTSMVTGQWLIAWEIMPHLTLH